MKTRKRRAKWYMQYIGECPVCGRNKSFREARYTKPPIKSHRYTLLSDTMTFDHCIY